MNPECGSRRDSCARAAGGFVVIAPGRAIGTLTTPGYDTEAARYMARLLGVHQVVLGVMLWRARNDRAWLRRVAALSALTEALDTAATLATSAAFLALRAAAS